jgi:anti-sigma regulatory factor (Ser/Thr protein kinase)
MTNTIWLPANFNFGKIHDLCRHIVNVHGLPSADTYTFDFQYLRFIDGVGLTVLANTIEWLQLHDVSITFVNFNLKSASIQYLDDCGFFEKYHGQKLRQSAAIRQTTLPFQEVAHASAHNWLENQFSDWMATRLGVPANSLGSLRSVVKELFHNIKDHANLENGFVHVQHYPNDGDICITVSDFGRGIPATIRQKLPELDDAEAILWALQEGNSVKSQPRNMGAGLPILVRNVLSDGGIIRLCSFYGQVICTSETDGQMTERLSLRDASYPGTLIDIRIRISRFTGDEIEEGDMSW